MTCEFLSGLTQLPFPSVSVAVGAGGITTAGTLYFYLTARNRAGWTIASSPIAISYPANSKITITLPAAARGLGTDFIRYSLSANTINNPIAAYQLGEWENYGSDQYTRRTLDPIVLDRDEHIDPAGSVAVPGDLPSGTDLVAGMHRLIIGGLPVGVVSSYYKHSPYLTALADGTQIIEPVVGEKWVRVSNPYTAQITDPNGIGGCAIDVRLLDPAYLLPPPAYDPVQVSPVKGIPIKLTWRNNSTIALKAGTSFGLEIRQGSQNRTDSFNGKLILTLRGYTDGLGGLDRFDASGVNAMPNVDVDRVWGYADDAIGILTLDKDLPPGASAVYDIAPYFTAQQFQGNLAANELISIYLYPYIQSGKNVGALWAIAGDMVLPVAGRMHVVPATGNSVEVMAGSAIVKGYTFALKPDQVVNSLAVNTANQKIVIDGNGICGIRPTPLGSEAIRAIVSTVTGSSKLGALSLPIVIATSGKVNLVLNYAAYSGDGLAQIRSDYPTIGGDLGNFNPPIVQIFAYDGNSYYPALSAGAAAIGVVSDFTQTVIIDSLGAAIFAPANPLDPLLGLFSPPTITGVGAVGGSIAAGSYQFFATYYYDGSTVSKIDHVDLAVIRESELSFADLYLLNQGWGRPIHTVAGLRTIDRSDTFGWQQRPVAGGSIFYYDPDSLAADNGVSAFKPNYLAPIEAGRWLIRKSVSISPAGSFNLATTYNYLDQITANGGAYLYINPTPSSNHPLTDSAYWTQTSFMGLQGAQGNTGAPGIAGALTTGANPNIPTVAGTATYSVDSTIGLAIGQYYGFDSIGGNLLAVALPSPTTITLQNVDCPAATVVPVGAKLNLSGLRGLQGIAGVVGATTVGANPIVPAIGASLTVTVNAIIGLAVGQVYGLGSIAGTLLVTALPSATTATLQNIDCVLGVTIPGGTKLVLAGRRGAIGSSGSPHIGLGAYSGVTTYNLYEEVELNGASYWWKSATPGNSLPPSADWQTISTRGETGATGMMGATTVGTNPVTPASGASATYTIDSNINIAIGQHYGFDSATGSFEATATTATSVTLLNVSGASGVTIVSGTKLIATGIQGIQGLPGLVGAVSTGANPTIPVVAASDNYSIDSIAGLAIGQYYGFSGIAGTLLLTGIVSANTITLQNIDATAGAIVGNGLKLVPTGKTGDTGSGGDMYRSQYDTDNDGVVDNAAKLAGNLPGYYLDRANHSGTQIASTISNFSEAVDDRVAGLLVAGSNITIAYGDTANTLTIASTASGGGVAAWTSASGIVNVPAIGGRYSIDASAGNVTLKLPASPSASVEVSYQIVDTLANNVYLEPASGNTIGTGLANYRGKHNPALDRSLIETLRYIGGRWLPCFGRLLYEAFVSTAGSVESYRILDINCDGGTIVDTKGHSLALVGAVAVSSAQQRAGTHSIALTGGHINVVGGTDFNFGALPYSIHLSLRMSTVGLGGGTNYPDNQYFCDFDSGNTSSLSYTSNGGIPNWRIANAGAVSSYFNETPVVDTWYDLVLAKVDSKYLIIRNNEIVAASTNAPVSVNFSSIRLGNYAGGGSYQMQGYLDSISVYKEIANGTDLTHAYPLKFLANFTGSTLNDSLGAVATVVGTAPTYDAANKQSPTVSALFDGSGHLSYPSIADYDLGSGGFEISFWFKAGTTQNSYAGIAQSGVAASVFDIQSWVIYGNNNASDNKIEVYFPVVSPTIPVLKSMVSINDNLPHVCRIIKYIIGASAVTVLILDDRIEDVFVGAYTIAATTRGLILGAETFAANRRFQGNIDDFAIYKA